MAKRREWHEPLVRQLIDENEGAHPEEIIERYADELRRQAGQDRLPIRPYLIASCHGIKRRRGTYDFAGRIYAEPSGQLVMDINEGDSHERQHFTEGHELMHSAFPNFAKEGRYRLDALMDRHSENKEEEYLCDIGAAAMLMPAELVASEYSIRSGLSDAERLSLEAEVSIEAAANRLVALADEPCVLLCLAWSHKPADRPALRKGEEVPERLRVRYGVTNHLNVYVPKFKSVDVESVFECAAGDDVVCRDITSLPGMDSSGLFRVEAKRYGAGKLERVLALCRPTA
jgi:hypothetical protein